MIPDRCRTASPHAPGDGSGEIAADRILHLQRPTLPLGLNTPAQAPPGRPPPPPPALAPNPPPPPALDDMTERPQIRGRPGHVQRLVQLLFEPGPGGVRPGGTDLTAPSRHV